MGLLDFDKILNNSAFRMGAGLLANNTGHYGQFGPALQGGLLDYTNQRNADVAMQIAQQDAEWKQKQREQQLQAQMNQQYAQRNIAGLLSQEPVELAGPPMTGQQMGYRLETNPTKAAQYNTLATAYPDVFQKVVQNKFSPEQIKPTAGMQDFSFALKNPRYMEFLKNKQPQTNINMGPQETERQKAYGKSVGGFFGDQFSQLQEGVNKAVSDNSRLDRLDQLLDQVNTGAASSFTQPLKRYAKDFGMDLESMGITDDTGAAEAASALANQMALELRNPAGGAGMPGAMSDKDREFLVSMVPQLTNTQGGRKLLIETRRRQNKRSMEVAQLARQYQQQNGQLDAGFYEALQKHAEANPLFIDLVDKNTPSNTTQTSEAQQVKTLEGKQFIKINGKWYQQ